MLFPEILEGYVSCEGLAVNHKLWIDGFAGGSVKLGKAARAVDSNVVDGVVNGAARVVELAANLLRRTQSGFLYHYAFVMIIGLIALLGLLMHFSR